MASTQETHENADSPNSEERPAGETQKSDQWKEAFWLALALLGLLALMVWLISVSPEAVGNNDFKYWMTP